MTRSAHTKSVSKIQRHLGICLLVQLIFIFTGVTRDASGINPAALNSCPAWLDDYDVIKHQPPHNYSVILRCGGRSGMMWAELPFVEEDNNGFSREGVNYLRVRLGYHHATLVVVETQVPSKALANLGLGRGLGFLESVKGVQIEHFDVIFSSGHWGVPEPHYDVRLYLVGHDAHQTFECQPAEKGGWFQFINLFK